MINASKVSSVSRVNWSLQLQQDLVEGKTYVVTMDGNDYNCTAYANSNINGFICLDINSTFLYANGYMLSNDLSYVGSKTISIKLVS